MWRWGRVSWLRVDNGSPFGDPTRQALSMLHLCLTAHGIGLQVNPPRRPTRNAKVERNQGTTSRWAEPHKCSDYQQLQEQLNRAVEDQREHYPTRVCAYQTRVEAHPKLLRKLIPFDPKDFELARVYRLLAKGRWKRKISDRGSVNLFWQNYQLGRAKRGQTVFVQLNDQTMEWIFFDLKGNQLSVKPIKKLSEVQLKCGIKRININKKDKS